jgi:16S rRNA processing protein RimM
MKELLELIAKALVDNPSEVSVSEVGGEQTTILELRVAQEDLGKVIGKQGRTARAIRTILSAAGMDTSLWQDMVTIGQVARSQGRRGEVVVNPLTDFPERFRDLERVFIRGEDGAVAALALEGVREQGGRPVLKFEGISDIGAAERLAGLELRIPESELVRLPEDRLYHFQIVGCRVTDRRGGCLGTVEDVLATGGTDVLVVREGSGKETLVPLCKEICRRIDVNLGEIEIDPPEGLITINAD